VACSEQARETLLGYAALLITWSRSINLTGARTVNDVVSEHLCDAFALADRLGRETGEGVEAIIDVGSGGGLPAIPLAILRPTSLITMFEPTGKKAVFLRTAIRELGLGARLRVEARRVSLPVDLDLPFDVALSRATFPPAEWLALAWRLVRPAGRVFALTSRRLQEWPNQLEPVHIGAYRGTGSGNQRWLHELRRST
jgi:16S rRNA (guanine527-N7)-methyltransferase